MVAFPTRRPLELANESINPNDFKGLSKTFYVAASRQNAANLYFKSNDCGALPSRRYGIARAR